MGGVNSLVFCSKSVAKFGLFFQIRGKTVHPGNGVHSHKKDEVVPVMLYSVTTCCLLQNHTCTNANVYMLCGVNQFLMQYHLIKKLNVGQNSTASKSIELWVNLNCFFLVIGLGV